VYDTVTETRDCVYESEVHLYAYNASIDYVGLHGWTSELVGPSVGRWGLNRTPERGAVFDWNSKTWYPGYVVQGPLTARRGTPFDRSRPSLTWQVLTNASSLNWSWCLLDGSDSITVGPSIASASAWVSGDRVFAEVKAGGGTVSINASREEQYVLTVRYDGTSVEGVLETPSGDVSSGSADVSSIPTYGAGVSPEVLPSNCTLLNLTVGSGCLFAESYSPYVSPTRPFGYAAYGEPLDESEIHHLLAPPAHALDGDGYALVDGEAEECETHAVGDYIHQIDSGAAFHAGAGGSVSAFKYIFTDVSGAETFTAFVGHNATSGSTWNLYFGPTAGDSVKTRLKTTFTYPDQLSWEMRSDSTTVTGSGTMPFPCGQPTMMFVSYDGATKLAYFGIRMPRITIVLGEEYVGDWSGGLVNCYWHLEATYNGSKFGFSGTDVKQDCKLDVQVPRPLVVDYDCDNVTEYDDTKAAFAFVDAVTELGRVEREPGKVIYCEADGSTIHGEMDVFYSENLPTTMPFTMMMGTNVTSDVTWTLHWGLPAYPESRLNFRLTFDYGNYTWEVRNGTSLLNDGTIDLVQGEPVTLFIENDPGLSRAVLGVMRSGGRVERLALFDASEYASSSTRFMCSIEGTYHSGNLTAFAGGGLVRNYLVSTSNLSSLRWINVTYLNWAMGRTQIKTNFPGWEYGSLDGWNIDKDEGTDVEWVPVYERSWMHGWWKITDGQPGAHVNLYYYIPSAYDTGGMVEWVWATENKGASGQILFALADGVTDLTYVSMNEDYMRVYDGNSMTYVDLFPLEEGRVYWMGVLFGPSNGSLYVNGSYVSRINWTIEDPGFTKMFFQTGVTPDGVEGYVHVVHLFFPMVTLTEIFEGQNPPGMINQGNVSADVEFTRLYLQGDNELTFEMFSTPDLPTGWQVWFYALQEWWIYDATPSSSRERIDASELVVWTSYNDTRVNYSLVEDTANQSSMMREQMLPDWTTGVPTNITVYAALNITDVILYGTEVREVHTIVLYTYTRSIVYGRVIANEEFDLLEQVTALAAPYLLFAVFPFIIYELTKRRELAPLGFVLAALVLGMAGQLSIGESMLFGGLGCVLFFILERQESGGGGGVDG